MATEGKNHGKTVVIGVIMTLLIASVVIGGAVADNTANATNIFQNPNFYEYGNEWLSWHDGGSYPDIGLTTFNYGYAELYTASSSTTVKRISGVRQTVDLTDVDEISFDLTMTSHGSNFSQNTSFAYICVDYTDDTRYMLSWDSSLTAGTENAPVFGEGTENGMGYMTPRTVFGGLYDNKTARITANTSSYTGYHNVYVITVSISNGLGTVEQKSKVTGFEGYVAAPTINFIEATIIDNNKNAFSNVINTSMVSGLVSFYVNFTAKNLTNTYFGISTTNSSYNANWTQVTSNPVGVTIDISQSPYNVGSYSKVYFYIKCNGVVSDPYVADMDVRSMTVEANPSKGIATFQTEITLGGTTSNISTNYVYSREHGASSWNQIGTSLPTWWNVPASKAYDIRIYGSVSTQTSGNYLEFETILENAINAKPLSVTWNKTSYTTADTDPARVTWDFARDYDSGHNYALMVFPSDNTSGEASSTDFLYNTALSVSTIPSTGSVDISCSYFTGASGMHITAYIIDLSNNNAPIVHSAGIPVTGKADLICNITDNNVVWTTPTTITLKSVDGTEIIAQQTNITTGTHTFEDLTTPSTFNLIAVTEGHTQEGKVYFNPTAGGNMTVTIDWTNGISGGDSTVGGAGSMYASTYVTFRVLDSGTGSYLSNVTVTATAVEATNPLDWIANLFGAAWGSKIQGTTLSGKTDDSGKITFAMFPVYRYKMTLQVVGVDNIFEYSFQPTELTTEEIISLPITSGIAKANASQFVITAITKENDSEGKIKVVYSDSSGATGTGTTTKVIVKIYKKTDEGYEPQWDVEGGATENEIISGSEANDFSRIYSMQGNYARQDYYVNLDCYVTAFYEAGQSMSEPSVIRQQGLTFGGVRIPIGNIPDGLYLVFSFGILVMLGAIGTQVTSRFYAIVVAGIGLFLLWAGWMGALGIVGEVACTLAFIFAVIYYIAGGNQPQ